MKKELRNQVRQVVRAHRAVYHALTQLDFSGTVDGYKNSDIPRALDLFKHFAPKHLTHVIYNKYGFKKVAGRWIGRNFSFIDLDTMQAMIRDVNHRINQKERSLVKGTEARDIPNYFA